MWMVSQTDIGRIRLVNEDRAAIQQELNGLSLAIVADGMGGHQAGDIASAMAVEMIQAGLQTISMEMPKEACTELLREAIETANENIYEFAAQRENYHGMGTTVVAVIASEDHLLIGHIGDSRAYKIHETGIEQLTEDHSLVNELVKNGQITPEEAEQHPRRNVLTRALGTEPGVEVDIHEYTWKIGDTILLCTDGLSGLVDPQTIRDIVRTAHNLEEAAGILIDSALEAGGDDNVTVTLLAHHNEIKLERGEED
jgi:serine/threonine protein phosphatase PrpC